MASPNIQITLDRPRNMRLTLEGLLSLEDRLKKPSGEIFQDVAKLSISTVREIVFVALRHEDPRLKPSQLTPMLDEWLTDGHDMTDLITMVNDLITASGLFGRAEGKKEDSGEKS